MEDLTVKWYDLVTKINTTLINDRAATRTKLVSFYEAAYECEAGCTCDNIHLEYDQLVAWQKALPPTIMSKQTELTAA